MKLHSHTRTPHTQTRAWGSGVLVGFSSIILGLLLLPSILSGATPHSVTDERVGNPDTLLTSESQTFTISSDYEAVEIQQRDSYSSEAAPPPPPPPSVNRDANKQEAWAQLAGGGWQNTEQYTCLESLWHRESGWNHYAENKSSGAYGIPQSLPGSKMASAGSDWRTNPATQIKWGLNYIENRYGAPCGAWSAFQSKGWY